MKTRFLVTSVMLVLAVALTACFNTRADKPGALLPPWRIGDQVATTCLQEGEQYAEGAEIQIRPGWAKACEVQNEYGFTDWSTTYQVEELETVGESGIGAGCPQTCPPAEPTATPPSVAPMATATPTIPMATATPMPTATPPAPMPTATLAAAQPGVLIAWHGRLEDQRGFEIRVEYSVNEGEQISLEWYAVIDGTYSEFGNDSLKGVYFGGIWYLPPDQVMFPTISCLQIIDGTPWAYRDDGPGGCEGTGAPMTATSADMPDELVWLAAHGYQVDLEPAEGVLVTSWASTSQVP